MDICPAIEGGSRRREPREAEAAAADLYEVLEYRARVGVSDRVALQATRRVLSGFGPVVAAPGTRSVPYLLATDEPGSWAVSVRGTLRHREADFATALAALEWHILTDALARCRDLFHLHGAALAGPDRRAGIVLIGDSGSGKTTLTLGLMLRGFMPFSDDVTLLDPSTLAAQPFRRAFHLEEGTRRILAGHDLPTTWDFASGPPGYFLPPQWALEPVPIRHVIFPRYQPGAAARLTRMSIPDAASTLLAHTISLARIPPVALAAVARLTAQCACYQLVTGDLNEALDVIGELVPSRLSDMVRPDPVH